MAIQGLPTAVGLQVVDFLSQQMLLSTRPPPVKGVSQAHMTRFSERLAGDSVYLADQTSRHVLRVARETLVCCTTSRMFSPEQRVLLSSIEEFLRRNAPPAPPHPSTIVLSRSRFQPEPVVWNPYQERLHWWALSDERFTPYHYHADQPQDVVIALGGHQGYNLVNEKTNLLVIVDHDARQAMNHALIAALVILSKTPDMLVKNYLKLSDPETRKDQLGRILEVLRREEQEGRHPPGRAAFFSEITDRVGSLSLPSLTAAYDPLFTKLAAHRPLTPRERPNVEWMMHPARYETVRKMCLEGRVRYFQANLFDPEGLSDITNFLAARDRRISTMYVSSAFDIFDQYHDRRECFVQFSKVIGMLPFHGKARILWTYLMPNNRELELRSRVFVTRDKDPAILPDPFDKYAYFEMPADSVKEWLAPYPQALLQVNRREQPQTRAELEGKFYYYRLGQIVRERGIWYDGKLWVHPSSGEAVTPRLLPSDLSALTYCLAAGDGFHADLLIRQAVNVYGASAEALNGIFWDIHRELSPRGRGHFLRELAGLRDSADFLHQGRHSFSQHLQLAEKMLRLGRETVANDNLPFEEAFAMRYGAS